MKTELQKFESPTPAALLQQAIESKVDIVQLKELMDLQERWEKKEAKKAFLDALSLFQTRIPELKKTKTAIIKSDKGNFTYKYSDLGSITKMINPILNECGLSYRWNFDEEKDILKVTCVVSHRDGHSEQTTMMGGKDMSGKKNDIQQKGSTHTYLQRYTLIGALGLSTADSDLDGKTTDQPKEQLKELSKEEILQQWTDMVSQCKTRIELTSYFLKNSKSIEKSDIRDEVKAIFKKREEELPQTKKPATVLP